TTRMHVHREPRNGEKEIRKAGGLRRSLGERTRVGKLDDAPRAAHSRNCGRADVCWTMPEHRAVAREPPTAGVMGRRSRGTKTTCVVSVAALPRRTADPCTLGIERLANSAAQRGEGGEAR